MISSLKNHSVVTLVYVDLITRFINTDSAENRMATGINEKVNSLLVFFTR